MAPRRSQGQRLTAGPSTRTQHVNHAIPQVQSSAAGLEGMGAAFSNFFGQAIATAEQIQDTAMIGERQRIEEENAAQEAQATNDFYAGNGPDEALSGDRDYMDTFKSLKAGRMATDAAHDFQEWYRSEWVANNRQGDLSTARSEWVRENLIGIDDQKTQARVLADFHRKTDSLVGQHSERAYQWQVEDNMRDLGRSVFDAVGAGEMSHETLAGYIEMARQLDPLNPDKAVPRMMATMLTAAQQNPGRGQQIIKMLDQPGTGIGDRSFAESYPEAYGDFVSGALSDHLRIDSFEEMEYWRGVEDRLNSTTEWTDEAIASMMTDLSVGPYLYNGGSRARELQSQFARRLDKLVKDRANSSRIGATLYGGVAMDGPEFRKGFDTYLKNQHGADSILELEPEIASDMISRMGGVVPENVKLHLSEAITNANSPEEQQAVLSILTGVKNARGDDYVNGYLSGSASRYYNHVASRLTTSSDLTSVLRTVNEARAQGVDPSAISFKDLTGERTESAGRSVVSDQINSSFQSVLGRSGFPSNVNIDPSTMNKALDYAQTIIAERGADGVAWEDAVEESVSHLMSNAEVIGSRDEKQLILRENVETENILGDPSVKLGYNITAPTGNQVNTIDLMWDDLASLDGLLLSQDELEGVSVSTSELPGLYQFKDGSGSFVMFEGGEVFTHNETHYVLPGYDIDDDESVETARKELEVMFGETIPDSIVMIPQDGGWRMMYAPHFGDDSATLASVEEDYRLKKFNRADDEMKNLTQALIASERLSGVLPYGAGVNRSMPNVENAEELISFMQNGLWEAVRSDGRQHVDRFRVNNNQNYRAKRRQMLVGAEDIRTYAYDDNTGQRLKGQNVSGKVTVGIGFNMERKGARETWNKVFDGAVDFDAVMSGKQNLTTSQAEKLFDYDMRYFEGVVQSAAGGSSLPENQHLALLSMAYNAPQRVIDMAQYVEAKDHANVIHSMLYEGFNPNHKLRHSLAARRYREAQLYAGSDPVIMASLPDMQTYLNHWR